MRRYLFLLFVLVIFEHGFTQNVMDTSANIAVEAARYKEEVLKLLDSLKSVGEYKENGQFQSKAIRNVFWGMSQSEVKELEHVEPYNISCHSKNNCLLTYKVKVSGDSAYLIYMFLYDKLVECSYAFYFSSTAGQEYHSMNRYLGFLKSKYGIPTEEIWDWTDPKDKNGFNEGMDEIDDKFFNLYAFGYLKSVVYKWSVDNMIVALIVKTAKLNEHLTVPSIDIGYRSNEYFILMPKYQKEYLNENF